MKIEYYSKMILTLKFGVRLIKVPVFWCPLLWNMTLHKLNERLQSKEQLYQFRKKEYERRT